MSRRALGLWAALALGLGLGAGLLYAWVLSPVQYVNTAPDSLRPDLQTVYVQWAARAFAVDGDLSRARYRLALLLMPDPAAAVSALAQEAGSGPHSAALTGLAKALGGGTPVAVGPSETLAPGVTPGTPTPRPSPTTSPTPRATSTVVPSITPQLLPTRTPTPPPLGAFEFVSQQLVCDPGLGQPLIQVVTQGADGEQVPGVEVVITWDAGFDHFFTGLKPDVGIGYGDFSMEAGIDYSVHLAESPSATIDRLVAQTCTDGSSAAYLGSWLLIYRQS